MKTESIPRILRNFSAAFAGDTLQNGRTFGTFFFSVLWMKILFNPTYQVTNKTKRRKVILREYFP